MNETTPTEESRNVREGFSIYMMLFSLLFGSSLISFLLGVASNKDVCFETALLFFVASLLLTFVWACRSKAARWLLALLLALAVLMGIQYLLFEHHKNTIEEQRRANQNQRGDKL